MTRATLAFTIVFGFGLLSCSSDDDANAILATPVTEIQVTSSNLFSPATVRVKVDDIVRWQWTGGPHNVVSGSNCTPDGLFTSGDVSPNGSFEKKFETVGTFPYYCTPHCDMGMKGEVIVEP